MLEKETSCLFEGIRPAKNTPFFSWCDAAENVEDELHRRTYQRMFEI